MSIQSAVKGRELFSIESFNQLCEIHEAASARSSELDAELIPASYTVWNVDACAGSEAGLCFDQTVASACVCEDEDCANCEGAIRGSVETDTALERRTLH